MKKRMMAMMLIMVMMFALVPTTAQAASVPCKVTKALAKAVEAFRKLGANYVQIAQAVTKAMAEAVEAEA